MQHNPNKDKKHTGLICSFDHLLFFVNKCSIGQPLYLEFGNYQVISFQHKTEMLI